MGRRIFGSLLFLRDDEARSQAPAFARIIQSIVGGAAWLHEFVSGQVAGSGGAVTPPNPQGEVGGDISGPPWGSAVRHPIAWFGGKKPDVATGFGMASAIKVVGDRETVLGPWSIWVRPFDFLPSPSIAPYSKGEIDIRAHGSSAGDINVEMVVENLELAQPEEGPAPYTWSHSGTTEGDADPDATMFVPLVPGWNDIVLRFISDTTARDLFIDSIVINQIVKRSH